VVQFEMDRGQMATMVAEIESIEAQIKKASA